MRIVVYFLENYIIINYDKQEVPMTEVDILKKNVRDPQEQLQNAYKRIKELSERE